MFISTIFVNKLLETHPYVKVRKTHLKILTVLTQYPTQTNRKILELFEKITNVVTCKGGLRILFGQRDVEPVVTYTCQKIGDIVHTLSFSNDVNGLRFTIIRRKLHKLTMGI